MQYLYSAMKFEGTEALVT